VKLTAPLSLTFHALKSRLAENEKLNPLAIRLLYKNKAISDSKSLHEVFGDGVAEAQLTVMMMKNIPSSTSSASTSRAGAAGPDSEGEEFWGEIRRVVWDKYSGSNNKEEVFEALRKGFTEKFGAA